MRALVIGGDSKIGKALCTRLLEREWEVVRTTRHAYPALPDHTRESIVYLDMLDPKIPPKCHQYSGREKVVVFIMAAITGVVPGENHPDAWRVNAEAPAALTLEATEFNWPVVFMSSGTVEMAQHTASAMQKRYAEAIVHTCGGLVVRPLPVVPAGRYAELCDLMIDAVDEGRTGLLRWEG